MGAAATPLAFGEIYTALQAGVLDGLEHDPPTIVASKFFETAKYLCADATQFLAAGDLFQRRHLHPHGPETARRFPRRRAKRPSIDTRAHGLAVEKEALELLKSKGVTVIECDNEAFRKRVLPQTDNFVKARPGSQADGGHDPRDPGLRPKRCQASRRCPAAATGYRCPAHDQ